MNIPNTPTRLVLFDTAGSKIVWKRQLKETDAPRKLQLLSRTKAFFENSQGIYEVALADGNLTKLPAVEGTLFVISPDKTRMAFLDANRIIVSSAANGANKKTVLELSESWQKGVRSIEWSPNGKRLLFFDEDRLLIVRLSAESQKESKQ